MSILSSKFKGQGYRWGCGALGGLPRNMLALQGRRIFVVYSYCVSASFCDIGRKSG